MTIFLPVNQPLGQFTFPPGEDQAVSDDEATPTGLKFHERFLKYFLLVLVVIFGLMIFRLSQLQLVEGAANLILAEGNRLRVWTIPAPRGVIVDRQGVELVKNLARYTVVLNPTDLPENVEQKNELKIILASSLNLPSQALDRYFEMAATKLEPIEVKTIEREEALRLAVLFKELAGVEIRRYPSREYVDLPSVGHLIGYIGKPSGEEAKVLKLERLDQPIGKAGIERQYDSLLRGRDGGETIEVNARGKLQRILKKTEPIQGNDLFLTLDSELQKVAAESLERVVAEVGAVKAAAVASDAETGGILAMVSIPGFDPNVFVRSTDKPAVERLLTSPEQPLLNRAIAGQLASGSTIKPVVAAAALEEGIITPSTTLDTSAGEIRIGEFVFPDWKVHGVTYLEQAIAESNNIFFYALAGGWQKIRGLGIELLTDYLKKFGFGQLTGIDLPGEAEGFIPTPEWKKRVKKERWYLGDTYHLGIGQGNFLVTPLQMTQATCAIARQGQAMKPRLVAKVVSPDGQTIKEFLPAAGLVVPVDRQHLETIRRGLRLTVTAGSARGLNDLTTASGQPVEVAAKTGTAQIGSGEASHGWLTAFAPYLEPKVCLTVVVERGGQGHAVALPVAKEILKKYFETYRYTTKDNGGSFSTVSSTSIDGRF